jgi:DNA-binding transcriptional ArsR family regulator
MNFSQLHCFVALADIGSFTETAYTTHLTQSAVSHALSALERELGVCLLERNNKGVVALTGKGNTAIPLDPPYALQIGLAVRSMASASPAALLFAETAVAWFQEQATLLPSRGAENGKTALRCSFVQLWDFLPLREASAFGSLFMSF